MDSQLAAGLEAHFVRLRLRTTGTTRDSVVLSVDVSFCLLIMIIGSQAAEPDSRLALLTVLLPFALVCPALLGFGMRQTPAAAALVVLLGLGWAASLYPNYTVKLASDLLGFALWFVVGHLIARELRMLASITTEAQEQTRRVERELATREREAAVERERALAHREIHDYLLPVVQRVVTDQADPRVQEAARQGLARARRFLAQEQASGTPFRAEVTDLCLVFPEATVVTEIEHDPPPEVAEAVLAAARESLNNARQHAGGPSNFYVRAQRTRSS
jgi:signal transduction histidine kinase